MQNIKEIGELTVILPPQALVRPGARNIFRRQLWCNSSQLPGKVPENTLDSG
jgi:hypothetical protein